MEHQILNCILAGYHTFKSKDNTHVYRVVQALYNENDISASSYKGTLLNVFVDEEIYSECSAMSIGSEIDVEVLPNIETGKIFYKIVI